LERLVGVDGHSYSQQNNLSQGGANAPPFLLPVPEPLLQQTERGPRRPPAVIAHGRDELPGRAAKSCCTMLQRGCAQAVKRRGFSAGTDWQTAQPCGFWAHR